MAEIPDHSVQPQIRVRYHSTGEVEVSITLSPHIAVAPDNNALADILVKERTRQYSATRHDSGYSEDSVIENKGPLAEEADEKAMENTAFVSQPGPALSVHQKSRAPKMVNFNRQLLCELSEEPELEALSLSPEIELSDKEHMTRDLKNSSSVYHKHAKLIYIFIISILLLFLVSTLVWILTKSKANHNVEKSLNYIVPSDLPDDLTTNLHCSSDCTLQAKNISIANGELVCGNDTLSVQCWAGFQTGTPQHFNCLKSERALQTIECSVKPCQDSEDITCSENLLILAGGEVEGRIVESVETFPPSNLSSCLPHLPRALKWGALGLLEETDLVLCGGQNLAEQPTRECWVLDNFSRDTAKWRHHATLTRC